MPIKNTIAKLKTLAFFDTFKHVSTYLSGTVFIQALGILSLPFFTSYLTPEEYGIVNVFTSLIPVLVTALSLGIVNAISRYYFEEDKDDFPAFLGTIIITLIGVYWFFGGILLWNKASIAYYLNLPEFVIKWLVLICFFVGYYYIYIHIMLAKNESKKNVSVEILMQYLKFGCSVLGILYLSNTVILYQGNEMKYTFMGKIIAETLVMAFIAFYVTKSIFREASFKKYSFFHVKYALIYSIPLIPFALSSQILTSFDQWFINSSIGHAQAGQYSFAYKIGMIYLGGITALHRGSFAEYNKYMNEKKYDKVYDQVGSISKMLILGGGGLMLFAVDLGTLLSFNKSFLDALTIAPVIIVAYIFHGITTFCNRGIYYMKKNIYLVIIILSCGVLNICLNAYFIPIYGYKVAAYTTLVSYITMTIMSIFITTNILKLPPLPLGQISKYIVILTAILSINYIFGNPYVGMHWGWISFKIVLFITLGASLFYNKIGLLLGSNKKT